MLKTKKEKTMFNLKNVSKMKNLKVMMVTLMMIFISFTTLGQEEFKWSSKIEVEGTKEEIYSKVKLFIGKTWKSPSDVIKSDDIYSGVVLVRGLTSTHFIYFRGATYAYKYGYEMTFKMRDGMFLIELGDVYCHSTVESSFGNNPKIEPHENVDCVYPNTKLGNKWSSECHILMSELKKELQTLFDSGVGSLTTDNSTDW